MVYDVTDPPGLKRPAERRIVRLVKFFLNLSIFSCFIYAITLLFGYKNGKFRISKLKLFGLLIAYPSILICSVVSSDGASRF